MKYLALLLLTCTGFALQGCSDGPDPKPPSQYTSNSSNSVPSIKPNKTRGQEKIAQIMCSACHEDQGNGMFGGDTPFDVNNLVTSQVDKSGDMVKFTNTLASYIETSMPKNVPGACDAVCAADIALYLASFYGASNTSSSDSSVSSDSLSSSSVSDSSWSASDSSSDSSSSVASSSSSDVVVPISSSVPSSWSSSVATSDSSAAATSSSAQAEKGDPVAGATILNSAMCVGCHVPKADGSIGMINVDDFGYPTLAKYAGYSADTEADLATFIEDNMPMPAENCDGDCALDAAAYLWSLRSGSVESSSSADSSSSAVVASSSDEASSSVASSSSAVVSSSSSTSSVIVVVPSSSSVASISSTASISSQASESSQAVSSSSLAVSSSSQADSSSSSSVWPGDPVAGAAVLADPQCALCHGLQDDGSYNAINVDSFGYPANYPDYSAASEADLAEFIEDNMPPAPMDSTVCSGQCALDAAAYLWSLRDTAGSSSSVDVSSSSVAVSSSSAVAVSSSSDVSTSSSADASSSSSWVVISSSSESSAIESSSSLAVSSSSASVASSESSVADSSSSESSAESSSSAVVISSSSEQSSSAASVSDTLSVSASIDGDVNVPAQNLDDVDAIGLITSIFGSDDITAFWDTIFASDFHQADFEVVGSALSEVGLAIGAHIANSVAPGSIEGNSVVLDVTEEDVGFAGKNYTFRYSGEIDVADCPEGVVDCTVNVSLDVDFNFPTDGPSGSAKADGAATLVLRGMIVNVREFTAYNDVVNLAVSPGDGIVTGNVKADIGADESIVLAGENVTANILVTIVDVVSDMELILEFVGSIGQFSGAISASNDFSLNLINPSLALDLNAKGVSGVTTGSSASVQSSSISSVSSAPVSSSSLAVSSSSASVASSESSVADSSSSESSAESSSSAVVISSSSEQSSSVASVSDTLSVSASIDGDVNVPAQNLDDVDAIGLITSIFGSDDITDYWDTIFASDFHQADFEVVGSALSEVGLAIGAHIANSVAPGSIEGNSVVLDVTEEDVGFAGKNYAFRYSGEIDVADCPEGVTDCAVNVSLDVDFNFPTDGPSGSAKADGAATLVLRGMTVNVREFTAYNDVVNLAVSPGDGIVTGNVKADIGADESIVLAGENVTANMLVTIVDVVSDMELILEFVGSIGQFSGAISATNDFSLNLINPSLALDLNAKGVSGVTTGSSASVQSSSISSVSSSSASVASSESSVAVSSSSESSAESSSSAVVISSSSEQSSSAASVGDTLSVSASIDGDVNVPAQNLDDVDALGLITSIFGSDDIIDYWDTIFASDFHQADFEVVGSALSEVGLAIGAHIANSVAPGSIEGNSVVLDVTEEDVGFAGKNYTFRYSGEIDVADCPEGVTDCTVNVSLDVDFNFPTDGPSGSAKADGAATLVLRGMTVNVREFTAYNDVVNLAVSPGDGIVTGNVKADIGADESIVLAGENVTANMLVTIVDVVSDMELILEFVGSIGQFSGAISATNDFSLNLINPSLALDLNAKGVSGVTGGSSASVQSSSIGSVSSAVQSSESSSLPPSSAVSSVSSSNSSSSSVVTGSEAFPVPFIQQKQGTYDFDSDGALMAELDWGSVARGLIDDPSLTELTDDLVAADFNFKELSRASSVVGSVFEAVLAHIINSVSPGTWDAPAGVVLQVAEENIGLFNGRRFIFGLDDTLLASDCDTPASGCPVNVKMQIELEFPSDAPSGTQGAEGGSLRLLEMSLNIKEFVVSNGVNITVTPGDSVIGGSFIIDLANNGDISARGQNVVSSMVMRISDPTSSTVLSPSLALTLADLAFSSNEQGVTFDLGELVLDLVAVADEL